MPGNKQLNQGQIDILKTIYKFRFGTRDLIAASLSKQNGNPIYSRLSILEERDVLARRYNSSYKLRGRAAEYYLTPSGLRTLRTQTELDGLDDRAIKASYKDKNASDGFIRRCLTIFALSNHLEHAYAGLQTFTKRELPEYDYFPAQLPDIFVSYKTEAGTKHFFIELFTEDTPSFAADRRLRQLIKYYEDDEWSVTEMPFPTILCVGENANVEKRLRKQIARALNRADSHIEFCAVNMATLLKATKEIELDTLGR